MDITKSSLLFKTGDVISLMGDNGKYLARCNGCVNGIIDGASIESPSLDIQGQWQVTVIRDNIIALKSLATGRYLGLCEGCATSFAPNVPNEVANVDNLSYDNIYNQWAVEVLNNGKIALKSMYNNKYLGRCFGCILSPASSLNKNFATVVFTNNSFISAQWTYTFVSKNSGSITPSNEEIVFTDYGALTPQDGIENFDGSSYMNSYVLYIVCLIIIIIYILRNKK